jgi:hypothetical protein
VISADMVPVPSPTPPRLNTGKWIVCEVGGKWAAIQPWAEPVYWLRWFDTFEDARDFVRDAIARASITA